ncbi:hypothetical protein ACGC1H_002522 [Rhizoctonia solani]
MSIIFLLSTGCSTSHGARLDAPRRYPNDLLQVCSRWRQIALASPKLWSHIDLDLSADSPAWNNYLLKRANMFVTRSKEVPLELHISTKFASTIEGLTEFCKSAAPRLQSLDLETRDDLEPPFSHEPSWLVALVSGATSGTPTRLRWKSRGGKASYLIGVDSMDMGRAHIRMTFLEQQLEEFLSSVTTLQLENVYPFWTSRAYHGLVELILDGDSNIRIEVKYLELEGILKASPGLQILRFGLKVIVEEGHVSYSRVELNELKSLCLTSRHRASQEAVLNTVHLGKTPLELIIDATESTYSALASSCWVELYNFAARSRITVLRIQGAEVAEFCQDTNLDPIGLLQSFPQLEVLVLDSLRFGQLAMRHFFGMGNKPILLTPTVHDPSQFVNRLRLLRLIQCTVIWTDLRRTLEMRLAEKLVLHGCQIFAHHSEETEVKTRLRHVGPFVELNDPQPH